MSTQKTRLSKLRSLALGLALLVTVTLAFGGCELFFPDEFPIEGTWTYGEGEKWVISEDEISYYSKNMDATWSYVGDYVLRYSGDVESFEADQLNGGDTSITSGGDDAIDPGYAVIKYTEVSDPSWGTVGKFNVFRWADYADDENKKVFTQGGKYNSSYTEMLVFDSFGEAKSGATNDNGYFGFATSGAALVE